MHLELLDILRSIEVVMANSLEVVNLVFGIVPMHLLVYGRAINGCRVGDRVLYAGEVVIGVRSCSEKGLGGY